MRSPNGHLYVGLEVKSDVSSGDYIYIDANGESHSSADPEYVAQCNADWNAVYPELSPLPHVYRICIACLERL
jgi:hypothetical protein